MKISKLFHWLYSILMLLPIGMVLGRTLFTILNINSGDYYPTAIVNQIVSSSSYGIDNAFVSSLYQINEMPIFSWASTSFIVAPFSYIANLFGMPVDSPIITLMSYWLSISIIWLVFDLIIYVPQLVHRWLDKGVIE